VFPFISRFDAGASAGGLMEKLRGFNLVYLATGQRNASRDSDVPGMKKVEAFRPKCRCRHSAHWLTPGGLRISE
jgi:hypothetical protein